MEAQAIKFDLEEVEEAAETILVDAGEDKDTIRERKTFDCAVIMVLAMHVGPTKTALRKYLHKQKRGPALQYYRVIDEIVDRARKNKIFIEGRARHTKSHINADWFNEETGTVSFLLDIMCLEGTIQRHYEIDTSDGTMKGIIKYGAV